MENSAAYVQYATWKLNLILQQPYLLAEGGSLVNGWLLSYVLDALIIANNRKDYALGDAIDCFS